MGEIRDIAHGLDPQDPGYVFGRFYRHVTVFEEHAGGEREHEAHGEGDQVEGAPPHGRFPDISLVDDRGVSPVAFGKQPHFLFLLQEVPVLLLLKGSQEIKIIELEFLSRQFFEIATLMFYVFLPRIDLGLDVGYLLIVFLLFFLNGQVVFRRGSPDLLFFRFFYGFFELRFQISYLRFDLEDGGVLVGIFFLAVKKLFFKLRYSLPHGFQAWILDEDLLGGELFPRFDVEVITVFPERVQSRVELSKGRPRVHERIRQGIDL